MVVWKLKVFTRPFWFIICTVRHVNSFARKFQNFNHMDHSKILCCWPFRHFCTIAHSVLFGSRKKVNLQINFTLYTSRKPLQHLLATGVPSCKEPESAHEQTCKISREELPHPLQTETRWTEREATLCLSDPLVKALHFCLDSCTEWGWPDTLGTIQGDYFSATTTKSSWSSSPGWSSSPDPKIWVQV